MSLLTSCRKAKFLSIRALLYLVQYLPVLFVCKKKVDFCATLDVYATTQLVKVVFHLEIN